MIAAQSKSAKILLYAMIGTLVVSFGAIGAILAGSFGAQYSLMGLFIGSAFGAFISVYESTIIGCITGMLVGLIMSPLTYYYIDVETTSLMMFTISLFGAIIGEPIAQFWREAINNEETESEENEAEIEENESEDIAE